MRTILRRLLPGISSLLLGLGVSFMGCGSDVGVDQSEGDPFCQVRDASLQFGQVVADGSSVDRSFVIRNVGGGVLSGRVSLDNPAYRLVSGGGAFRIPAGQLRRVTVRFQPAEGGLARAEVQLGTGCRAVPLAGEGLPATRCTVAPTSMDFGRIAVGETLAQEFTIQNSGGALLSGDVVSNCESFVVVAGGGPFQLAANDEFNVRVEFRPTTVGDHNCLIEMGLSQCEPVNCTGVAEAPASCVVSPMEIDFGEVTLGTFAERSFEIQNAGGGVIGGSVSEGCGSFLLTSGGGPFSLLSNERRTVVVRFQPVQSGDAVCFVETGTLSCSRVTARGRGAVAPLCDVQPAALDFGQLRLGTSATRDFAIKNIGGGTLRGDVQTNCPGFSVITGGGPFALAANQELRVTVRFEATSPGTFDCTVLSSEACTPVSCVAVAVELPVCLVDPRSLSFGSVAVGQTADRSFTIRNGGGSVLQGQAGETCDAFEILAGGEPFALAAGQERVVTVRFEPVADGAVTCPILLGTASCPEITATGTGTVPPSCVVEPTTVDFGGVSTGTFAERTFVVRNAGGGALEGTIQEDCGDFAIVSGGGFFSLGAGEERSVVLRYSPVTIGNQLCDVELGLDGCAVRAIGRGEPPPACFLTPTSVNFGAVAVGSASERSVTIQNVGGGRLIGNASTACPEFSLVSGDGPFDLGSGERKVVTVRFGPLSGGAKTCVLDLGDLCADVTCSGRGEDASSCEVNPVAIDFGAVEVGSTLQRSFSIHYTGAGTLSGNVTESCDAYLIVSGGGNFTLGPNQSRTVVVRFAPTATGRQDCTIATGTGVCTDVACTGLGDSPPLCEVEPTSLDCGVVALGQSADRTFTIRNAGGGTLQGSVSETCSWYSLSSGGGAYSLGAGQTRTVTVHFQPPSLGSQSCTIQTGNSACADVEVTGQCQPAPSCEITPSALAFGAVPVGGSSDRSFTIKNAGGGTLSGSVSAACANFSILSGSGDYSLAGNQSVVVTVRFSPTASGSQNCVIETGAAACADVSASGTGDPPAICSVDPTSLEFGTVSIGTSAERSFTVRNVGGQILTGTVSESCAGFSLSSGGGAYSLGAGEARIVVVRFEPASEGPADCTIQLGNAGCGTVSASGTGERGPVCAIDPGSLDFGSVDVGATAERSFTIRNSGGGTLTGSISENCDAYSIVSGGGAYSLGENQFRSVTVRFAPTSEGSQSCTIETGSTRCSDVACDGVGTGVPVCTVDPTSLNYGNVVIGQSRSLNFSIRNTGGGTLTGSVTEACAAYTITAGAGSYSLGPGASRNVTVRFTPGSLGTDNCTVNTGSSCAANVACTGDGTYGFASQVRSQIVSNCGGCHFQGSGPPDISDYDTAAGYTNGNSPTASELLVFPNDANQHGGGFIPGVGPGSQFYEIVLRWIQDGILP